MKQLVFGLMIAIFATSAGVVKAAGYGMAGCGLGAIVLGNSKGIMQIFASTLNGISGNQTFAITMGTSNCAGSSASAAVQTQKDFIANNLAPLSKEMAQGKGETLSAFTETLGCSSAAAATAHSQLQKSHGKIFASPGAYAVLETAKNELRAVPEVAAGCTFVSI